MKSFSRWLAVGVALASSIVVVSVFAGTRVPQLDIAGNQWNPGEPLPMSENASLELALPFSYRICGREFDSVFVNSNGNLTFGPGDEAFKETAGKMLANRPRTPPCGTISILPRAA